MALPTLCRGRPPFWRGRTTSLRSPGKWELSWQSLLIPVPILAASPALPTRAAAAPLLLLCPLQPMPPGPDPAPSAGTQLLAKTCLPHQHQPVSEGFAPSFPSGKKAGGDLWLNAPRIEEMRHHSTTHLAPTATNQHKLLMF